MKRNRLFIMALSLILCMSVSIGFAVAYFTDYENAKGGAEVSLSGRTEIEEDFDGNDKLVRFTNTGDTDVVVRVKAFGEGLEYTPVTEGDWVKGADSGYWYFAKVLKKDESTSVLRVSVTGRVDPEDPIDFEVTVVHEAERVTYEQDSEGNNTVKKPDGWSDMPDITAEAE